MTDDLRDTVQVEWSLSSTERETLLAAVRDGQGTNAMKWAAADICRPDLVAQELADELANDDGALELTNRQLRVIEWSLIEVSPSSDLLGKVQDARQPIERIDPGGTHSGYRGANWPEQREKALEEASRKCEQCGVSNEKHIQQYGQGLHVHHEVPFQRFNTPQKANELSNLTVLCNQCHPQEEIRR